MRGFSTAISAIAIAVALGAAPASAATVLSVGWSSSCSKGTCFDDKGVFQHTWSADKFQAPVTIGKLLLDRGVLGALDGSTFSLHFSLNGVDLGSWGHFNMGGIAGDELSFTGADIVWDPADGDLVLTLTMDRFGGDGGLSGFSGLSAPHDPSAKEPDQPGQPDTGALGEPETDSPGDLSGPVPEPAAWALMLGGFGLAGAALRRRSLQSV